MYKKYKLVIFNDSIGRTCFGELAFQDDSKYVLKNPAMIVVSPNESGQMKVDVIPLFFNEFITPSETGETSCLFNFNKNSITTVEVDISDKILEHYFTKINIKEVATEEAKEEATVEYFEK